MASTRKKTTKDGREYYEIRVRPKRGKELTRRWYVPDGWGKKAIDRELAKQAAEFEREVKAGEVLTRAEKQEQERLAKQEEEKHLTFQQFTEKVFMPAISIRCSENTRYNYQCNLKKHILPVLGEKKMKDITPAMVSALLLSMQGQGLANATCIKSYTILLSVFKMAYMQDHVEKNIMDKVERPKPRKDEEKKEIEAYTASELKKILECLEQEPLKWQALIWLLSDTGMRSGEAVGIKWEDIDFSTGKLTVHRSRGYNPDKGNFENPTKNNKSRTIDLSPKVVSLLIAWREEQTSVCTSPWVFNRDTEKSPEAMQSQTPTKKFTKLKTKYGIPGFHPHKLRHSFASVAITHGADIASVSEKLGHSDKAVTLRMYTHADEQSIKRAGDIFRKAVEKG